MIDAFAEARRAYVDSNVLIYFVEGFPKQQSAARRVFETAKHKDAMLITSELTLAECLYGAFKKGDAELPRQYRTLMREGGALTMLPVDGATLELAASIGPMSKLRLADSIHVATAIEAGCDLFVTNDDAIRYPLGLKVARLIDG